MSTSTPTDRPADAAARNWVDRFAPDWARPWLRLMRADRPIGTWLLLIPCWQGLALALAADPGDWPAALRLASLFAVGAVVMRGAGCAWNDVIDRDIDRKVSRTALRPVASGAISRRAAMLFLVALSLIGFAVLIQFNAYTIVLGVSSLALVAVYPFMKRLTWWPQAFLGLTFNWGALMGYSAIEGGLAREAVALYAAGMFWTLGYDTIYAHQDKEDDALIGVKSSARRLGSATKPALALFYGASLALLALAGFWSQAGAAFYVLLALPAMHFAWQVRALDPSSALNCLNIFKSNREAGLLVLAALSSQAVFQVIGRAP